MLLSESDPKMKLFGKTIELPDGTRGPQSFEEEEEEESYCSFQDPPNNHSMLQNTNINGNAEDQHSDSDQSSGVKQTDTIEEDQVQPLTSEDLKESNVTPAIEEGSKADSTDKDAGIMKASKSEEDQSEADHSQEKTLKKPDKILPCPRCNSMETKFCYFNNYNVNQPRHFCKKCQRYWTAGGTMRSVPVGAGRRKNKNTPQFRHLTTPESVQSARVDHPKGVLNSNGTVLTFSSDTPLCESIASVLNIADKTIPRNGYSQPGDQGISVSYGSKEIGDDGSSGSSVTAASIKDEVASCHPFPPQVPFFPGGPWAYPWIAPPTFGPASFPSPYFPTGPPYWACAVPGTWNIPWVIPSMPTALSSHTTPFLGSNSPPTLGKHSRDDNDMKLDDRKDEEAQEENNSEKCLWVPKTLRIDDPEEAAKSSIWATLGIKNDRVDSIGGGGLFKAFQGQSKDGGKTHVPETSTVLQANPAALSRSLNFHENS